MYIPGRLRICSNALSVWIFDSSYVDFAMNKSIADFTFYGKTKGKRVVISKGKRVVISLYVR